MYLLKQIVIIGYSLIFFPCLLGAFWGCYFEKKKPLLAIAMGYVSMFAFSEVLLAPMVQAGGALQDVTNQWYFISALVSVIIFLICIPSWIKKGKEWYGRAKKRENYEKIEHKEIITGKTSQRGKNEERDKKRKIGWMPVAIVVFLVLAYFFSIPVTSDDTVEQILTMQATGQFYSYHPYLGTPLETPDVHRMRAPLEVLYALWSVKGNIRPTLLVQKLLPVFFILCCMGIYREYTILFFQNEKKERTAMFLMILCFFASSLFFQSDGAYGLISNIWMGKTLLCCMLLPLSFYLLLDCARENRSLVQMLLEFAALAIASQLMLDGAWIWVLAMAGVALARILFARGREKKNHDRNIADL